MEEEMAHRQSVEMFQRWASRSLGHQHLPPLTTAEVASANEEFGWLCVGEAVLAYAILMIICAGNAVPPPLGFFHNRQVELAKQLWVEARASGEWKHCYSACWRALCNQVDFYEFLWRFAVPA